jgi:GNAT superfamily N-acetyltransferase
LYRKAYEKGLNPVNSHSSAGIRWRSLGAEDRPELHHLDSACKQADGYEPVSRLAEDALQAPHSLAAFHEHSIIALVWQKSVASGGELIGGRVHPQWRGQGLGHALLEWALPRCQNEIILRDENLSPAAHALYTEFGFVQDFAERMLVRSLEQLPPAPRYPENLTVQTWEASTRELFRAAYRQSFATRPGFDPAWADEWAEENEAEESFLPACSRVLLCSGQAAAFLTADQLGALAWVSQAGVVPEFCGQGLMARILADVLRQFASEGYSEAGLHVNINNPGALKVYQQAGFRQRLLRARYHLAR